MDLVIAAESLFLGEVGSPKDRGEIAYRFTFDPRHRSWLHEGLVSLAREAWPR